MNADERRWLGLLTVALVGVCLWCATTASASQERTNQPCAGLASSPELVAHVRSELADCACPQQRVYRATVLRVIDGDTVEARIVLGLGLELTDHVRLAGVSAPEIRGPEREQGRAAAAWLRERVDGRQVWIVTPARERGKFGRVVGVVFEDAGNVNDALVAAGHATYRRY